MTGTSSRVSETLGWLVIAIYAAASLLPSFFSEHRPRLLAFSLYRARRGRAEPMLSTTYWAQPPVQFVVMALAYPADYLAALVTGRNESIVDAWSTLDLREMAAIVSLFTMVFVAVTYLLILARRATR